MTTSRRTVKKKQKSDKEVQRIYLFWSIVIPAILIILFAAYYYRGGIRFFVKNIFESGYTSDSKEIDKHNERNIYLMSKFDDKIFGIDISEYQGNIEWVSVNTINDRFPIDFIFIRATMGTTAVDKRYKSNWKSAERRAKLRGAYHYFRPNENSVKQARNFIKTVKLMPGDLPPVLDIEERPRKQSMDSLKVGLKRWLETVESHYKVRPIIYSGDSYYTDFLEHEFADYTLWIANYNFWVERPKKHWNFWQFSEKGSVRGIRGNVDLNLFDGNIEQLERLCVPFGN
ncbi:glycoside hydrolase family 25 protein [Sphingobacterium lumbrici]|uniref:glycoside hydrolase family 25 protein n=1 Tax=Sphingobacterium lumbrici TaxID=2559600 RepID=UPI001126615A|nr:glycoside hydrolase family 25 protein [Sphingobacterium lumbrici]